MHAPTGLHGWMRSNDGRSIGLFGCFLLAIQLIAPLALLLPLLFLDPHHAPFTGWGGYAARYVPLVLLASIGWFAAQLWWHVETVKRAVGFHFVDDDDEPRLCRLIESLIILAGLPAPFVGVIESDARNAFACGIGRQKAVVVVTRGLIDALSDAELGAVLAHELSHIKHGDIRLMAAANIFMSALDRLQRRNALRFTWLHGVLALAVPALLPISLAGSLIGRWGLQAGRVSRLLIASSREFIADAQAAQWTQDPGALATALLKVDGQHRIAHARAEDDAMMIAGDSDGPDATHPTVAQRVAALARVTGSMVWNAPHAPRDEDWTATTARADVEQLTRGRMTAQALARVRRGNGNVLGLSLPATVALMMTVGALIGLHWERLGDPRAMASIFDPRPLGDIVGTAGSCELGPFSPGLKSRCDAGTGRASLRRFEGQENSLAGWFAALGKRRREQGVRGDGTIVDALDGTPVRPIREMDRGQSGLMPAVAIERSGDGLYRDHGLDTHNRPVDLVIAETHRVGCFVADAKPMEANGPRPIAPPGATPDDVVRLRHDIARVAGETRDPIDWAGVSYYLARRESQTDEAYMRYGQPGLAMVRDAFVDTDARAALDRVRRAARTLVIPADVDAVRRAKLAALLRNPDQFVPCRSLTASGRASMSDG